MGWRGVAVVSILAVTAVLALSGVSTAAETVTVTQQTAPTNNTSVQHERPENVSESGNTTQVSRWLENRLTTQLQQSTVNLSQGEYERARDIVGDDYGSRLEQYVEVAGETEGSGDDNATETLDNIQSAQRSYINASESYNETYEEYQAAREAGNETAARAAARELENISTRITRLNDSLQNNYTTLENQTGIDTDQIREPIANATQEVTTQQASVRIETFVETSLRVYANRSTVGYTSPVALSGRLTTPNETGIAGRTIDLSVGNRRYEVPTDEHGEFALQYRPVTLPANTTNITIRYLPDDTSPYLGSETAVAANVTQVTPSLSVTAASSEAGYGDQIELTATMTVNGRPVSSLPVTATLGDSRTESTTDEDGVAILRQNVSADVPTGNQTIRVSQPREDTAIGAVSTTVPVTIMSTATELTVNATPSGEAVLVGGRLRTVEGNTITNQPVDVSVGETGQTVRTNESGWYQVTIANVSAARGSNTTALPVTVQFDGTGTNLEGSRATGSVTIATSGETSLGARWPLILLIVGGILMLLVMGVLRATQHSETATEETGDPVTTPTRTTQTDSVEPAGEYLERARTALAADDFRSATIGAYAAVRRYVTADSKVDDTLTHQEFRTTCETELDSLDSTTLSKLADAYEQATFNGSIDPEAAAEAVAAAASMVSNRDEGKNVSD